MTVRGIDVDVVYKDIKNLHIGVYPPMGRVRVAAPAQLDDDQVRLAVIQRLGWIKRQREVLRAADRQSQREMVTGESHYVWGTRHRLTLVEADRARVAIDRQRLLLFVPTGTTPEIRRDLLARWYRTELRGALPPVIARWEEALGVAVARWSIRRMKTKWGSCNREMAHVWFNLELAKKHPDCLNYIVAHELAHLIERHHDDAFTSLMDKVMPQWRALREQLNGAPLAYEEWLY